MSGEPYGVMGMFDSAEGLLAATRRARAAGFTRMDAYTPIPVAGLAEMLERDHGAMGWWVVAGGVVGAGSGYLLQWWTAVVSYPLNIGGRPIDAWPAFLPVAIEMAALLAALFGFVGMLIETGLPRLNHPVFNSDAFASASRDRFFLCIESGDRRFHRIHTAEVLKRWNATEVFEVEP